MIISSQKSGEPIAGYVLHPAVKKVFILISFFCLAVLVASMFWEVSSAISRAAIVVMLVIATISNSPSFKFWVNRESDSNQIKNIRSRLEEINVLPDEFPLLWISEIIGDYVHCKPIQEYFKLDLVCGAIASVDHEPELLNMELIRFIWESVSSAINAEIRHRVKFHSDNDYELQPLIEVETWCANAVIKALNTVVEKFPNSRGFEGKPRYDYQNNFWKAANS